MESTSTVSSFVDAPARLSPAQRRDLLGQAIAAVITSALIAAPLVNSLSGRGDVSSEATLPAQSFAAAVSAVAVKDAGRIAAVRSSKPRVAVSARVRADGRLTASAVPAVALQPEAVSTSALLRDLDSSVSRKPLARKLTGWLTGDGTHRVRPFPTVATRQ